MPDVATRTARRRASALAVHSIDHFTIVVPDLEEARRFYAEFGLDVRDHPAGLGLFTFDHPHCWGTITRGARKELVSLSFGAYEEDMPLFRERLDTLGISTEAAPNGGGSNGIWLQSPEGVHLEIKVADKCSPDSKAEFGTVSVGPGQVGSVARSRAPRARPRRLSHFALFTNDVSASLAFYEETLGLRLSDRSAGIVAFMHGAHGSDHHLLALISSSGPGMHHMSWDIGRIQEIGIGAEHMAAHGYRQGWGLGQHVLGSNYFHYVRDPWGSYAEYSCDIDYIPADVDWPSGDHDPHDSFYLWGPTPPADFTVNYERESNPVEVTVV